MFLQFEHFAPLGVERLVFGVSLHVLIDELQHTERIALAVYVGRGESLGTQDFHLQPTNIVEVVERVEEAL